MINTPLLSKSTVVLNQYIVKFYENYLVIDYPKIYNDAVSWLGKAKI